MRIDLNKNDADKLNYLLDLLKTLADNFDTYYFYEIKNYVMFDRDGNLVKESSQIDNMNFIDRIQHELSYSSGKE